jgi:[acyl-carrier-protein] S-malonyltransferase
MGEELAKEYPQAAETFLEADEALGFSLSELCFEGPKEELTLTQNTQPALLAVSVAVFRVLSDLGCRPDYVAGHSLGEYSALVAAEALNFDDALRLVRKRGQFMQEAVPVGTGAMAAIIGLDLGAVEAICEASAGEQVVSPANENASDQIAISGHAEAVKRACELALEKGAKRAIPLPVSAPFHCSLMEPAKERMVPLLEAVEFRDLQFPLVNNVDAAVVRTGGVAREALIRQIPSAVRWTESIHRLTESGVGSFVEVGAGRVLTGLIRRIARGVDISNVEKPEQVKSYVQS